MSSARPTLVIANKAYSSWSLRPWIAMVHFGLPFDEVVVGLQQPDTQQRLLAFSPTAKAPVLIDSGNIIWDSLAILEYLAETHPDIAIWPKDRSARAHARVLAAEMHSSFQALRQACPMNFRRARAKIEVSPQVMADVTRIEAAWADARKRFGADGPFLFGAFCAADAMFAPVVNRLDVYALRSYGRNARPYGCDEGVAGVAAMGSRCAG